MPLDLAYPTISSEHLVFENINGELYVTDVSRNGTARASRGDSVADYYWESIYETMLIVFDFFALTIHS